MSNDINPLTSIALTPLQTNRPGQSNRSADSGGSSFFEAMARAWGDALDNQASEIQKASDRINGGDDKPAALTELSTQSLKMSFLANSSQSSINAVGQALQTMARKQ